MNPHPDAGSLPILFRRVFADTGTARPSQKPRDNFQRFGEAMKKILTALGTALAALGLFAQVSTADAHLLGRRNASVTAACIMKFGPPNASEAAR